MIHYRKNLLISIDKFEKQYPVKKLIYKGINVWPLIRFIICQKYENIYLNAGRLQPKVLNLITNAMEDLQFRVNKFKSDLNEDMDDSFKSIDPIEKSFGQISTLDALFFSRPERHFSTFSGYQTSGHEDFLMGVLSQKIKVQKWERENLKLKKLILRFQKTKFFKIKTTFFSNYFDKETPDDFYDKNNKFFRNLEEKIGVPKYTITQGFLSNHLVNLEIKTAEYFAFMKKLNPSVVYVGLYYAYETSALILACKLLNIPVVEIQHGFIGKYQWFQTHWNNLPKYGHSFLPDYFWVWDYKTKRNIENSFKSEFHKMIVGGKPSELYKQNFTQDKINNTQDEFLKKLKNSEKVILVALQYSNPFPELFIQTILKSPKNWVWLIRPHPMSRPLEKIYHDLFIQLDIKNVDVIFNNSIDSDMLLDFCDHVVSEYSTMIYDAQTKEIPVTFTHQLGKEMTVRKSTTTMRYLRSPDKIIEHISNSNRNTKKGHLTNTKNDHAFNVHLKIIEDWGKKQKSLVKRLTHHKKIDLYKQISSINLDNYNYFELNNESKPNYQSKLKSNSIIILKKLRLFTLIKKVYLVLFENK